MRFGRPVSVRLPPRVEQQLEVIADKEGNPVSAVCRRLITAALEGKPKTEAAKHP